MGENSIRNEEGFMDFLCILRRILQWAGDRLEGEKLLLWKAFMVRILWARKGNLVQLNPLVRRETLIIIMGLLMPITCWGRRV
jgi:hypothetical protein